MTESRGVVVVLGRRDYIAKALGESVMRAGFEAILCHGDSEAMRYVKSHKAQVLLLSGGIEPNSRILLRHFLRESCPETKLLEHFGGPATLASELEQIVPIGL